MKRFRFGEVTDRRRWPVIAARGAANGTIFALTSGFSAVETGTRKTIEDRFYALGKRFVDIVVALTGLTLLSPLLILIGILVVCDSDGPILHRRYVLRRQSYAGGEAQTFAAYKFRTMHREADAILRRDPELYRRYQLSFKLRNDPRVTRLGAFLRRSSLDEIPQLWNVLTGEMTLVGPRMISPPELSMYAGDAALLLSVKPGMTGLWQVSGRQDVSYADRVRFDLRYIRDRSLRLDFSILLRTPHSILSGKGAC